MTKHHPHLTSGVPMRSLSSRGKLPKQDAVTDSVHQAFSRNAANAVLALSKAGFRMRVLCTGTLLPNGHDETPEVFLKDITIDSLDSTQNGRFWGLSRRVVDGRQVVDLWALIPPEEARK